MEAPYPHYSIRLASDTQGRSTRALHLLYEGDCLAARSKQPLHVLEALLRYLSERHSFGSDSTAVRCVLLARNNGDAVLLGPSLRRYVVREASQLAAAGLEIVPTPFALLEGVSRQVRLPAVPLQLAFEPLTGLSGASTHELRRRFLAEHHFPLEAWVFPTLAGRFVPVSRPVGVAAAADDVLGDRGMRRDGFRHLVRAMQTATPIAAGDVPPWEVARSITDTDLRY